MGLHHPSLTPHLRPAAPLLSVSVTSVSFSSTHREAIPSTDGRHTLYRELSLVSRGGPGAREEQSGASYEWLVRIEKSV